MRITASMVERLRQCIQPARLVDTATRLIEIPSPTRSGAAVANRLAELLTTDGFLVERPEAGWPEAPAVAARWQATQPGKILQFNGHLDTVHLPFVPPRVEQGVLYGSGAADMKGGIAAAVEAMRALRDAQLPTAGGILLTAHDLHESPWGDGSQVDQMIRAGYLGDAVLLPEYLCDRLPVVGRGLAVLQVKITRQGEPIHEVLGGMEQPSVIAAGAELVQRMNALDRRLAQLRHPLGLRESLFIGQVQSGEIYNQSPTEFQLQGTRRWLSGTRAEDARSQFHELLEELACDTQTTARGEFVFVRDAFELDQTHPFLSAFQSACQAAMGRSLPIGAKPFVDDGNTFVATGRVPAITHGPDAKGAHTLHESVPVAELVRVALLYALTAVAFCGD